MSILCSILSDRSLDRHSGIQFSWVLPCILPVLISLGFTSEHFTGSTVSYETGLYYVLRKSGVKFSFVPPHIMLQFSFHWVAAYQDFTGLSINTFLSNAISMFSMSSFARHTGIKFSVAPFYRWLATNAKGFAKL